MAGTLALVGSGEFTPALVSVDRELLVATGRSRPRVAILPTASAPDGEPVFLRWAEMGRQHFTALGAEVECVLVRSSTEANDPGWAQAVGEADLVYLSGGKPSSLLAAIAGTAVGRAMAAAHERLNTRFGLALLAPPYDGADPRVKGTATYPPGAKENGGIFCHANAWAIVAAAMLGDPERAYAYYRQILPLARTDADRFRVEPYVYCQNICGPTHPQFGLGRNAWLTGTASWTYVAGTQWLLGIRPTYDGLRIAPAIPTGWPGFEATRTFRGVRYEIAVRRAGPGSAVSLVVDGRPVPGDVVPLPPAGTGRVRVEVTLA